MISRKIVAAQLPPNQDVSAGYGHQGPMSLQNSSSFASYQSHPQKLVRLIGCRDLNAANRSLPMASALQESGQRD